MSELLFAKFITKVIESKIFDLLNFMVISKKAVVLHLPDNK